VTFDVESLIKALRDSALVAWYDVVTQDEAASRAFYKIRCTLLVKPYKLEIKVIITATELLYAYQLYSTKALLRWDNEPHFPALPNFPHHYHRGEGDVLSSPLTGKPEKDVQYVLQEIVDFLATLPIC
jgi:hypothetical protein